MSRVHDALRRAGQAGQGGQPGQTGQAEPARLNPAPPPQNGKPIPQMAETSQTLPIETRLLEQIEEVPFNPAPESHLIDLTHPQETPSEEFRSLRTKLNHLQTLQPIHTVVITSPSPAEGKSFTAINLAIAESHLAGNMVLLADFDLRRPTLHNLLQMERGPGVSDFLMGNAPLPAVIKKISGTNLYVMPAGTAVKNPLELLNLREVKTLIEQLPAIFNWVFLDTPPLLFSADANLLSTLTDGTILVVRIGATTIDTITRATQSLAESTVLGIVANGARATELYSKYAYYYSRSEEA
jgi:protein-tyrosine kinase